MVITDLTARSWTISERQRRVDAVDNLQEVSEPIQLLQPTRFHKTRRRSRHELAPFQTLIVFDLPLRISSRSIWGQARAHSFQETGAICTGVFRCNITGWEELVDPCKLGIESVGEMFM